MLYFLLRLGAGYLLGLLAVVLLFVRPTLFPQFTVNAGLLTVAAVIGWQAHARLGGAGSLVAACLLAFFGFLIRDKEFLLVLGMALPFLPWRALREQRQMQIAFLLLGVAIASAAVFDHWSYQGPEWQQFQELNPARSPFGDFLNFGAGDHLKQRPEIMAHHGYSQNDIDLMVNYFSVDPQIADPKSLNAMLTELGPLPMQEGSVKSGFVAIKALFGPELLPLLLSALLFLVLVPRWPVTFAWMLCPGCFVRHGHYGTARRIAGICALGESATRRTPHVREVWRGRSTMDGCTNARCSLRWKRIFTHAIFIGIQTMDTTSSEGYSWPSLRRLSSAGRTVFHSCSPSRYWPTISILAISGFMDWTHSLKPHSQWLAPSKWLVVE